VSCAVQGFRMSSRSTSHTSCRSLIAQLAPAHLCCTCSCAHVHQAINGACSSQNTLVPLASRWVRSADIPVMPPQKSEYTVALFPNPIIKFGIVPAGPLTSRMWTLTQWTSRARSGCCQRIHSPSLRRCAPMQAHVPCISIPVLRCLAVLRMLQHTPWQALSIHLHSQLAQQGQHCRAVK
jgi:hypothetical protein